MTARWRIRFTSTARAQLDAIKDLRLREVIAQRIESLRQEPGQQGKPMGGDLAGYRSLRAAGQRFRILYKIINDEVVVVVVAVGRRQEGSRADVYAVAARLLRQGLLDAEVANEEQEGGQAENKGAGQSEGSTE
jgi:mRNA interferase RelE/StbE